MVFSIWLDVELIRNYTIFVKATWFGSDVSAVFKADGKSKTDRERQTWRDQRSKVIQRGMISLDL